MKIYIHNKFDLVVTHFLLLPLQIMTFLSFITLYPPSTLAYPNLNRMLDSLLSAPVSSTSSTFSLPISTVLSFTSVTSISYSSLSALPPISSMLTSATFSSPHSSSASHPLLPEYTAAFSSHLQYFSAVRKMTRDLQQQKLRHPKRPQLPPGEAGTPSKRIVNKAVYKQIKPI